MPARTWAAAILLAAPGCGGAAAPGDTGDLCGDGLGHASAAIRAGSIDDGDPAVVAVNTLDVACLRTGTPECTGTLIAPDTVLTAAHCVGEYPPEDFVVLFGTLADQGQGPLGEGIDGSLFHVTALRRDPAFDPGTLAGDLALLRLDHPAAVTPRDRQTAAIDAALVGQTAAVVGFGRADTGPPTRKRRGTVSIKEISATEITYDPDPAMTCDGDSGGPLLMTMDNREVVIGVTSRGDAACADHGVAIRVDAAPSSFFETPW